MIPSLSHEWPTARVQQWQLSRCTKVETGERFAAGSKEARPPRVSCGAFHHEPWWTTTQIDIWRSRREAVGPKLRDRYIWDCLQCRKQCVSFFLFTHLHDEGHFVSGDIKLFEDIKHRTTPYHEAKEREVRVREIDGRWKFPQLSCFWWSRNWWKRALSDGRNVS